MTDLSNVWPLGLGERRWWQPVAGVVLALAVAFAFDRQLSVWAQSWPESLRGALEQITPYGESDWILYPSGAFVIVMALLALLVRWKLMRTLLWQFSALFGFIFLGVGVPSLFTTLVKHLVGRGRPEHFDQFGLFHFTPNWLDWSAQSFPSGHATTAFALAAVVGFISERWFYPGLVFASTVAVSRVALGVHYTSDVIAGAVIGLLGAYLIRWLFARLGWLFRLPPDGRVQGRQMSSLKRYLILKRRGTVKAQLPSRP